MSVFVAVRGRFWRMLVPKWASDPLNGAGAARRGGRFNEPGCPALYMSTAFATAVAEYEQDLGIRPGTLCAYDVDAGPVADLTDAAVRERLGVENATLRTPWKRIAFIDRARPPTWELVRRLRDDGAVGVMVPSVQAPGGVNLVLWRWNDALDRRVTVLDPLGDLPADRRSWPPA